MFEQDQKKVSWYQDNKKVSDLCATMVILAVCLSVCITLVTGAIWLAGKLI